MKLSTNALMTGGAIALALFSVWYITRRDGPGLAAPGPGYLGPDPTEMRKPVTLPPRAYVDADPWGLFGPTAQWASL